MALTPSPTRAVHAAREMPGIVDFEGPVVDAAAADPELLGAVSSPGGCLGPRPPGSPTSPPGRSVDMALTPSPTRGVHRARGMPGIVDFEGPVVDAAAADPELLGSGLTACIGTDQAMLDLVPALVDAGCRIKVFEDRPRLVLPDGLGLPGRAGTVRRSAEHTSELQSLMRLS